MNETNTQRQTQTVSGPDMNELAFYALAGASLTPRDLIQEVRDAEAMGIGFLAKPINAEALVAFLAGTGALSGLGNQNAVIPAGQTTSGVVDTGAAHFFVLSVPAGMKMSSAPRSASCAEVSAPGLTRRAPDCLAIQGARFCR